MQMIRLPVLVAGALSVAAAGAAAQGANADRGERPSQAPAAQTVDIQEWQVPWENTRPRDPFLAPDGRVWFVGQAGNYLAWLDPRSGDFTRVEIEEGTHPHNLIVSGDGTVWYAGNRNATVGRLNPATGEFRHYRTPEGTARDPHTLAMDSSGDIWFTSQGANYIGKLSAATGEFSLAKIERASARPYGIVLDAQGRVWFNLFGTSYIGMIAPGSMTVREFALPRENARSRRIAVTPDGMVWYVDYAGGYLGRLNPANGEVREWAAPRAGDSRPYAMTSDDRGRLWFVETGPRGEPNQLVGFDPSTASFFSVTPIPSGGGTVRHMVFNPSSREIWFGTDANTIGRARVP